MVCVRWIPAFMLFLGTFVNYVMRVSINIVIIAMTANATELCNNGTTTDTSVLTNSTVDGGDRRQIQIFCWSEAEKSQVLGAFYYGYIVFQIPGGRLAELYGTRRVLGLSTLFSSILLFLSPFAAVSSVYALIATRVLVGLAQGVMFPSINPMLVRWSCKTEHSKFYACASMGGTFGTIFIYPVCGALLTYYPWQVIFYISGVVSLIWCVFWFLLVTDDPSDSRFLPTSERDKILTNRVATTIMNDSAMAPPLRQILLSPAVWALMFCSFANDWGLYMLLTEGPNYISTVLGMNIATMSYVSCLPYIGRFAFAQIAGFFSDWLLQQPQLSKLNVRRSMFAIAFLSPAIGLASMGFLDNVHWGYCIAIMTISFSLNGFNVAAFINVVDIAPFFSGTVTGVTNGFSASAGFLVPLATAWLIEGNSVNGWKLVFLTGTTLYVSAVIVFACMGRADPLQFNNNRLLPEEEDSDQQERLLQEEEEEEDEVPEIAV